MHREQVFTLSNLTDLAKVAAAAAVHAPFALPLYRAARDGLINLIQVERGAQVPQKMLDRPGRPIVVLIGDDDYRSCGPSGWACGLRVRRWARGGMIHAAGGEIDHYHAAVTGALATGRFVFVETTMARHSDWRAFLGHGIPILNVIARDGIHPAYPQREGMN